jgi:hypothetical protein
MERHKTKTPLRNNFFTVLACMFYVQLYIYLTYNHNVQMSAPPFYGICLKFCRIQYIDFVSDVRWGGDRERGRGAGRRGRKRGGGKRKTEENKEREGRGRKERQGRGSEDGGRR